MKNRIYYFTGTGNSLKVAKELANGIGDTELVRITSNFKFEDEKIEYERVGIVTPVYMGDLPSMVKDFLQKIKLSEKTYIFSAVTCGGIDGISHNSIEKILSKKNLKLSSKFTFHLPANNQTSYAPASVSEQERLFANNLVDIKNAVNVISNYGSTQLNTLPFMNILIKSVGFFYNPKKSDVHFRVEDNCVVCGICEKVCPAKNIVIEHQKPVWNHNCERCTACMQLCPKGAIQFKEKSKNWGRYHHPDIKLEELMI